MEEIKTMKQLNKNKYLYIYACYRQKCNIYIYNQTNVNIITCYYF